MRYLCYLNWAGEFSWHQADGSYDWQVPSSIMRSWVVDPQDRRAVWRVLTEASAAGANLAGVAALASKTDCDVVDSYYLLHHYHPKLTEPELRGLLRMAQALWGMSPKEYEAAALSIVHRAVRGKQFKMKGEGVR